MSASRINLPHWEPGPTGHIEARPSPFEFLKDVFKDWDELNESLS